MASRARVSGAVARPPPATHRYSARCDDEGAMAERLSVALSKTRKAAVAAGGTGGGAGGAAGGAGGGPTVRPQSMPRALAAAGSAVVVRAGVL